MHTSLKKVLWRHCVINVKVYFLNLCSEMWARLYLQRTSEILLSQVTSVLVFLNINIDIWQWWSMAIWECFAALAFWPDIMNSLRGRAVLPFSICWVQRSNTFSYFFPFICLTASMKLDSSSESPSRLTSNVSSNEQRKHQRCTVPSSSRGLLKVPWSNTKYGDRSFSVCAPTLWNSLPNHCGLTGDLSSFKDDLKP